MGSESYLDAVLYVISLRYHLTPYLVWKNPEIFRHQSRKIKKSLVILMKNNYYCPLKIDVESYYSTYPGKLYHDKLEYAVFLSNLLATFFLI